MELKRINNVTWEIPKQGKMNVPVVIFASEKLLELMKQDDTLKQAMNMAFFSGVFKKIVVLSDGHQGYGACIWGVTSFYFYNLIFFFKYLIV